MSLDRFKFVVYASACTSPDEECGHDTPPREFFDDYAGEFECQWCAAEGRDDASLILTEGYAVDVARVVAWATEHMTYCPGMATESRRSCR